MAKPFSKFGRRSRVLLPEANSRVISANSLGPEPIHQDTNAIAICGRLVNLLDLDGHYHLTRSRECAPEPDALLRDLRACIHPERQNRLLARATRLLGAGTVL